MVALGRTQSEEAKVEKHTHTQFLPPDLLVLYTVPLPLPTIQYVSCFFHFRNSRRAGHSGPSLRVQYLGDSRGGQLRVRGC